MPEGVDDAWRAARDLIQKQIGREGQGTARLTRVVAEVSERAARSLSGADLEARDGVKRLTGMLLDHRPIEFLSSDVWSKPLIDANGIHIGATFMCDEGVANDNIRWAKQETRKADTEVVPAETIGQWYVQSPPEVAPWAEDVRQSGQPPNYFFLDGADGGNYFVVSVETEAGPVHVALDGPEGGQLLEANQNSARAIGRNPAGGQVLIACRTGARNASAGRLAAEYLHSKGTVTGNIYAPTNVGRTFPPDGDRERTELYVDRHTANGKLFETYRAPVRNPRSPGDL